MNAIITVVTIIAWINSLIAASVGLSANDIELLEPLELFNSVEDAKEGKQNEWIIDSKSSDQNFGSRSFNSTMNNGTHIIKFFNSSEPGVNPIIKVERAGKRDDKTESEGKVLQSKQITIHTTNTSSHRNMSSFTNGKKIEEILQGLRKNKSSTFVSSSEAENSSALSHLESPVSTGSLKESKGRIESGSKSAKSIKTDNVDSLGESANSGASAGSEFANIEASGGSQSAISNASGGSESSKSEASGGGSQSAISEASGGSQPANNEPSGGSVSPNSEASGGSHSAISNANGGSESSKSEVSGGSQSAISEASGGSQSANSEASRGSQSAISEASGGSQRANNEPSGGSVSPNSEASGGSHSAISNANGGSESSKSEVSGGSQSAISEASGGSQSANSEASRGSQSAISVASGGSQSAISEASAGSESANSEASGGSQSAISKARAGSESAKSKVSGGSLSANSEASAGSESANSKASGGSESAKSEASGGNQSANSEASESAISEASAGSKSANSKVSSGSQSANSEASGRNESANNEGLKSRTSVMQVKNITKITLRSEVGSHGYSSSKKVVSSKTGEGTSMNAGSGVLESKTGSNNGSVSGSETSEEESAVLVENNGENDMVSTSDIESHGVSSKKAVSGDTVQSRSSDAEAGVKNMLRSNMTSSESQGSGMGSATERKDVVIITENKTKSIENSGNGSHGNMPSNKVVDGSVEGTVNTLNSDANRFANAGSEISHNQDAQSKTSSNKETDKIGQNIKQSTSKTSGNGSQGIDVNKEVIHGSNVKVVDTNAESGEESKRIRNQSSETKLNIEEHDNIVITESKRKIMTESTVLETHEADKALENGGKVAESITNLGSGEKNNSATVSAIFDNQISGKSSSKFKTTQVEPSDKKEKPALDSVTKEGPTPKQDQGKTDASGKEPSKKKEKPSLDGVTEEMPTPQQERSKADESDEEPTDNNEKPPLTGVTEELIRPNENLSLLDQFVEKSSDKIHQQPLDDGTRGSTLQQGRSRPEPNNDPVSESSQSPPLQGVTRKQPTPTSQANQPLRLNEEHVSEGRKTTIDLMGFTESGTNQPPPLKGVLVKRGLYIPLPSATTPYAPKHEDDLSLKNNEGPKTLPSTASLTKTTTEYKFPGPPLRGVRYTVPSYLKRQNLPKTTPPTNQQRTPPIVMEDGASTVQDDLPISSTKNEHKPQFQTPPLRGVGHTTPPESTNQRRAPLIVMEDGPSAVHYDQPISSTKNDDRPLLGVGYTTPKSTNPQRAPLIIIEDDPLSDQPTFSSNNDDQVPHVKPPPLVGVRHTLPYRNSNNQLQATTKDSSMSNAKSSSGKATTTIFRPPVLRGVRYTIPPEYRNSN